MKPVSLDAYLSLPIQFDEELSYLFDAEAELVIFDIGSCEGEDAIRYARKFRNARVFAFEPVPANQKIIRHNLIRYGAKSVTLVPVALSDKDGIDEFFISSGRPKDLFFGTEWNYGNKSSSLLAPSTADPIYGWVMFKETISVQCETLATFCKSHDIEHPDFIHMDVQGAEHLVLKGAGELLKKTTAIWLEVAERPLYAGQQTRPEIEHFMRKAGFSMIFELRRDLEGDQLYVNTRRVRALPLVFRRLISHRIRRARYHLGAIRDCARRLFN